MKICLISPFPPEKIGTAEYSFYLVRSLKEACSDCEIWVLARSLGKPSVTRIGEKVMLFRIWKTNSFISSVQSILAIIKILISTRVDVLHLQYHFIRILGGSVGEPFLVLIFLAKRISRNLRIVVSLHDFWLPHEAEQRFYEITKSKVLAKLYRFYYTAYVRTFLSIPDVIICIVHATGSPLTRYIRKYTKRKVFEIPHGLPYAKQRDKNFKLACKETLSVKDKFTVFQFGFIQRNKGYEYIIEAVDKIVKSDPTLKQKIKVLVAGIPAPEETSYLEFLKELVHKLDLDKVLTFYTKYLNEAEVDQFFRASDLTIISYTRRVGPSGVFSFALAYEVPSIIAYDRRYITPKTRLPAVAVNLDANEIASAILRLMNDKGEYARQIELIKDYKAVNSNKNIALLHLNLYRSLCAHEPTDLNSP